MNLKNLGWIALGLAFGIILGVLLAVLLIPPEVIIIKEVPAQTLPGIMIP